MFLAGISVRKNVMTPSLRFVPLFPVCFAKKVCQIAMKALPNPLRIQLEFGRLTNMSMATIAKSGQLALQATLLGLVHAKCSQDR